MHYRYGCIGFSPPPPKKIENNWITLTRFEAHGLPLQTSPAGRTLNTLVSAIMNLGWEATGRSIWSYGTNSSTQFTSTRCWDTFAFWGAPLESSGHAICSWVCRCPCNRYQKLLGESNNANISTTVCGQTVLTQSRSRHESSRDPSCIVGSALPLRKIARPYRCPALQRC